MNKISNKLIVILAFFLLISFSLSSVSATTCFVNETMDSEEINNWIDNMVDITSLHFKNTGSGVYNGIVLNIIKAINVTCDANVSLVATDEDDGYAFSVSANSVNITGFKISGYINGIIADGINNFQIISNTLIDNEFGVSISDSNNVKIDNNTITGSGSNGVSIDSSNNLNLTSNAINNGESNGISISDSGNVNIAKNTIFDNEDNAIAIDSSNNTNVDNIVRYLFFDNIYIV
ncbi:right-handed parallel beta-helix repeat-containing protein [Methanobrevibacter filiformis]|uniref:Right handed beta helix domain-containing protein n=1 Tax=Methanobrevibacter filiformis TaxID=55758 RepID=A0A162FCN4_9EURY|nr:right-handed parallel beta-helix repeat-containing protein [Methanobrevibacter filiformis]KZX11065.1 hypothetical protein MBFIL_15360 [Methanobrevibacter filiformis]